MVFSTHRMKIHPLISEKKGLSEYLACYKVENVKLIESMNNSARKAVCQCKE